MVSCDGIRQQTLGYPFRLCDKKLNMPYFAFITQLNIVKGYEPSPTTLATSLFVPCQQNINLCNMRAVLERFSDECRKTKAKPITTQPISNRSKTKTLKVIT